MTATSHSPFDYKELPRTLRLGSLEGTKVGHYLHAIHYADAAIGKLVARLTEEGMLDKAVFVIYGDHQGVLRRESGSPIYLRFRPRTKLSGFEPRSAFRS